MQVFRYFHLLARTLAKPGGVLTFPYTLWRPQHIPPSRHQITNTLFWGTIFCVVEDLLVDLFHPANRLNFGPPPNAQNLTNPISKRFWLRCWPFVGSLLASVFFIFHESPTTGALHKYNAKCLFSLSKSFHFGTHFQ